MPSGWSPQPPVRRAPAVLPENGEGGSGVVTSDDPRLTDQRAPLPASVTPTALAPDAVTGDALASGPLGTSKSLTSQEFVAGVRGWSINAAGDAEFNNLRTRGVFTAQDSGTNLVPNSDFEIDVSGWAGGLCTLSQDTVVFNAGAASLLMTSTASGTISAFTPQDATGIPVLASTPYRMTAVVKNQTTVRTGDVSVVFMDSGGAVIGGAAMPAFVNIDTVTWSQLNVDFITPSNCAFVSVEIDWSATGVGQKFNVDTVVLAQASYITASKFRSSAGGGPRLEAGVDASVGVSVRFVTGDSKDTIDGLIRCNAGAMILSAPNANGTIASIYLVSGTTNFISLNNPVTTTNGTDYADRGTSWIPVLTASTTNPVLGTGGTIGGGFARFGKRVMATVNIHFGSGGGFTPGSGTYTITLPSTTDSTWYGSRHAIGTWTIRQGTSGTVYSGQCRTVGGSSTTMVLNVSTGGSVTHTDASVGGAAGNWPAGTDIEISIEYFEA